MLWNLFAFALIGLISVAIARLLRPKRQPLEILDVVVGVAGSLLGGLLSWVFWPAVGGFAIHPGGVMMSILGALALLWLYSVYARRSRG